MKKNTIIVNECAFDIEPYWVSLKLKKKTRYKISGIIHSKSKEKKDAVLILFDFNSVVLREDELRYYNIWKSNVGYYSYLPLDEAGGVSLWSYFLPKFNEDIFIKIGFRSWENEHQVSFSPKIVLQEEHFYDSYINALLKKTNNILVEENKLLKNENTILIKKTEKLKINFEGMCYRNKLLEKKLLQETLAKEKIKKTLSYRVGFKMVNAFKNLNISTLKLPYELYQEYKVYKKNRLNALSIDRSIERTQVNLPLIDINNLKIAVIMDEFTYNSYKNVAQLLELTPDKWQEELERFNPDLLFIESAWKGKNDLWETKISNCSNELVSLLQWCHDNRIKTMFWNKEDPVHFDTFLPVAGLVDYVFTTDIDSVPKYKNKLKHNNVDVLPFAAEPSKHNPIEIYERKDRFNFAGSYYLRYPERQKDFDSLIHAIKLFKPIDIYDRNYYNPHPHYTFPDEYKPMILGKLPFSEIDKAYKGYKYGINMNTIKQSQSMFARRVFELLASNTVVVSNFAKGVRLLFGDLVISSDNKIELQKLVKNISTDETYYRKFRLLGLRKVMSEHLYTHRLEFVVSKLNKTRYLSHIPLVFVYAEVENTEEMQNIIQTFLNQNHQNKRLLIYKKYKSKEANPSLNESIEIKFKFSECLEVLMNNKESKTLLSKFNPQDYYGTHYLTDLALACNYGEFRAYGKVCHYINKKNKLELMNDTAQYKPTSELNIYSSVVKLASLDKKVLIKILKSDRLQFSNMLSIDEFNYCQEGYSLDSEGLKVINDLSILDKGVSLSDSLYKISSKSNSIALEPINTSTLPTITAKELFELILKPASAKVKLSLSNNRLIIVTKLGIDEHSYIYAKKKFTREEINLVLNSKFILESNFTMQDMRTVFEFQDEDGVKISHSINRAGEHHALAIPRECVYIRFGLKVVGNGKATIFKLVLGEVNALPVISIAKSKKLILTKQYPSYDDIYKYGFLHSRVRAYKKEGLLVDVFRINNQPQAPFREFEDIDVTTGNAKLLEETLKTGQYNHVLVHLIDQNMWKVLEKFIGTIKVTVWVHGAEIQVWKRREYEFERFSKEEITRQKRLSANRVKFWQDILKDVHENLDFVFVSKYFKNESLDDLSSKLDKNNYTIIHNFIDNNLFKYNEKRREDRKKILTIRPYASKKYANDLSVKAVLLLSKKSFFNKLEFHFVGDGELFESTLAPLTKFYNVKIEQKFLSQYEIVKYHKEYGVFLSPTRMDSQGVSRDEAMSSGLVPITTNVAAIPEFVDNACGMVVEPENPQALADAIEFLYMNPEKYLELSIAAAKRVREQCGFEETIAKEIELITKG